MALALIPTKPTKKKGEGVCLVTRGPRKGKFTSCRKTKSGASKGKWVARKPASKLTAAGKKRRSAATGKRSSGTVCRLERVSKYGNVTCKRVCRKNGKVTSRTPASGCSSKSPRSTMKGLRGRKR